MDLVVSVEYLRHQLFEVEIFYHFFMQNYDIKELMFYLFMRSIAEKELNVVITRLVTGDVRQLKISVGKCLKVAKIYVQNSVGGDVNDQ
eukprot:CAMPEP_0170566174 /NCGR_PEP_ID=MMETSP0211-20121228/79667_1 /TAXON_ID=311385 /ORGANISM="Pseudokeronopsis sp., Strain OXSARD2" /LENGTH=88 /DNA_ID=CAMNT_0010887271 /DNA_START=929 /DNA_END=1195 /DNA_ORIENTATION=-